MNSISWKIYFDGYSSPHKQDKAGWVILVERDGKEFYNNDYKLCGNTTNNRAELAGLVAALEFAKELYSYGYSGVILGDSKFVINSLIGLYKIKNIKIKEKLKHALTLYSGIRKSFNIKWISRDENKAGKLVECIRKKFKARRKINSKVKFFYKKRPVSDEIFWLGSSVKVF